VKVLLAASEETLMDLFKFANVTAVNNKRQTVKFKDFAPEVTLVVKQEDDGLGSCDDEDDTLVVKHDDDGPRPTKKTRASELEQLSKSKNKLRFLPGFGSDSFRFRVSS
jgi:hypothetical protein